MRARSSAAIRQLENRQATWCETYRVNEKRLLRHVTHYILQLQIHRIRIVVAVVHYDLPVRGDLAHYAEGGILPPTNRCEEF